MSTLSPQPSDEGGGQPGAAPGAPVAQACQFTLDGVVVRFEPGDTVMQAARRAGHYIPHLCWHPRLGQSGACRLCTVRIDGRWGAACTTRAAAGQAIENRVPAVDGQRRLLLQMLFVEGNHYCPGCEKSGDCLLQATAYEMGMTGPRFEEFSPSRPVDASHPSIWLDLNRCILCKLCVRASHEIDRKNVFAIGGHGVGAHLIVDSPSGQLGDSALANGDFAASVCPVGAILPKRRGFNVPIGERRFDRAPVSRVDPHAGPDACRDASPVVGSDVGPADHDQGVNQ